MITQPAKVIDIKDRAELLEFMVHLIRQYADVSKPQELRDQYMKTAKKIGESAKLLEDRANHHKYSHTENYIRGVLLRERV